MKLNIKDFLQSPDKKMEFSGKLEHQQSDYDISNLNLIFPIEYSGTIFDLESELLLDLSINYKYNTHCDRCLKPLVKEQVSNLKGYFVKNSDMEYEDGADIQYFELCDGEIFLDDIIISQVITSMPFKNLCDEFCKGLCPKCGKDLNEGLCGCEKTKDVDLRFEKLMNLFNDEEV
ncbi:DUF177 domain-containing protein [Peptoniphilus sp. oral taxon 386]|uniref:YceD family protein n=1 Tax=Peptoniphilus sp. oral taxon 386 TaxID=652713 RepID=UPI0001DA9C3C|nr:DUF177 domain-containing protein [Peptoniphilus sp. oral taxon 386]EFI42605.1 putative ACR, COG1399 [Peptoniphilus sp. oral taxon 386 str. F0131]